MGGNSTILVPRLAKLIESFGGRLTARGSENRETADNTDANSDKPRCNKVILASFMSAIT